MLEWIVLLGCLDPNSSVWYPQCGTWLINLVVEIVLFAFGLNHASASNAFVYAQITIQACRLLSLALLPVTLVAKPSKLRPADEETAPLLGHRKQSSTNLQCSKDDLDCGSIPAPSDDTDIEESDEDTKYERRKAQKAKLLEDRLLENGNWFTYVLAFYIIS